MAAAPATARKIKRVLILGGGFAGTSTAITLGKLARDRSDIEVDFVSDENYFVFQPMLPEVAAGGIEASHIVNPIRRLCPYVNFHRARVEEINLEAKTVKIIGADITKEKLLNYDHLVVCIGLIVDLKRNPGMAEHSMAMKTLGDAFYLRNAAVDRLEQADPETDPDLKQKLMTFVVVGGGFSGVETIAELNDMIKDALRYYPNLSEDELRVVLIHSRERILQELSEDLAEFTQDKLKERGVELILNARVTDASGDSVRYQHKGSKEIHTINTKSIICTIGNAPHPVVSSLPIANGRGRIETDEFLRVITPIKDGAEKVWEGLWACGDASMVRDITKLDEDGKPGVCPPTAQYAIRQGTRLGHNIWASMVGGDIAPFRFGGLGQMAVIGKLTGVAQIMGINFSGFIAFFLWRLVYWMKLPGVLPKLRVALDWGIDLFFPTDVTQLNVFRTEKVARQHFHAGAYIFHEGDIGDSFYAIEKGEVDIIKEHDDGSETLLATLKEGDSFGEIALLKKVKRTAGAKCRTPVDVISLSRSDFEALSSTFRSFREDLVRHIENIMAENKAKVAHQVTQRFSKEKVDDGKTEKLDKAFKDFERESRMIKIPDLGEDEEAKDEEAKASEGGSKDAVENAGASKKEVSSS